ncbi:hypothetical protein WAI453_006355 [Rhynchosporium graminicola]
MLQDTAYQGPPLRYPSPEIPAAEHQDQASLQSIHPINTPISPSPKPSFPSFSLLPPEIRLQINTHHIQTTLLPPLRIKIRLPSYSTTSSRFPPPVTLQPIIPALQHVNHELLSEYEKTSHGREEIAALKDVFETQGHYLFSERQVLFRKLAMVGKFCGVFGGEGELSGWGVRSVAVKCEMRGIKRGWLRNGGEGLRAVVKMVRLFGGTVRSVWLVGELEREEREGVVREIYGRLEEWLRGLRGGKGEREDGGDREGLGLLVKVVEQRELEIRNCMWTVVNVR